MIEQLVRFVANLTRYDKRRETQLIQTFETIYRKSAKAMQRGESVRVKFTWRRARTGV